MFCLIQKTLKLLQFILYFLLFSLFFHLPRFFNVLPLFPEHFYSFEAMSDRLQKNDHQIDPHIRADDKTKSIADPLSRMCIWNQIGQRHQVVDEDQDHYLIHNFFVVLARQCVRL